MYVADKLHVNFLGPFSIHKPSLSQRRKLPQFFPAFALECGFEISAWQLLCMLQKGDFSVGTADWKGKGIVEWWNIGILGFTQLE